MQFTLPEPLGIIVSILYIIIIVLITIIVLRLLVQAIKGTGVFQDPPRKPRPYPKKEQ